MHALCLLQIIIDCQYDLSYKKFMDETDIVYRLRKRAEIRRQITTRKSVQNGERDRIADLLEEAADEIESLRNN